MQPNSLCKYTENLTDWQNSWVSPNHKSNFSQAQAANRPDHTQKEEKETNLTLLPFFV